MADDLLGGVLGGDDERTEAEAPQVAAGAEAFAASVAARLSSSDPAVARETVSFLKKQTHLLDLQAQHLHDEHTSRLTHLRLTVGAARRKRYADHMRNCLYTCIALLVLGVLLAVARMTFQAMRDHGLVVEDFTVPSDLVARGATSQALAEDLASRVAAIGAFASSRSIAQTGAVHADQGSVLKVQIPETGISIDELERFLHRWLGHQTVVNGELLEQAGGSISLVLHIGGADPIVMSGSSADLEGLMQAAAEKAFAIFDPSNDVVYLRDTGRPAEAYDAAVRYAHNAHQLPSRDRAAAYALLAFADPDPRRGLSSALIATDIDPRVMSGWSEAMLYSLLLGHDEAAVDFARKAIGTKRRDQPASRQDYYPYRIAEYHGLIDRTIGDLAALRSDVEVADQAPIVSLVAHYSDRAQVAALLHDETMAQQDLTLALAAGPTDRTVLQARWDVSTSAGDWAQALDAAKALVALGAAQTSARQSSASELTAFPELALETQYDPLLAYTEAMTGDTASATALISQTPTDCYLCVRTRAKVAAVAAAVAGDPASAAGDAATADRWFAEAVRQAPDLPMAYYEWGQALLARGDLAGAARELALAHEKGPHFADPLKAWGDVLAKQGHWSDALAKYDEALKYAPNWAALKQARRVAAKKS